ncbi:D-alanyl-D-alanine carboxypeptidase family protein [Promicromonospora citrea]|nr:M15 family metallopeptidase [Promicromonospora citrea]NNH53817.1 hypothetical protein [Promicromonospora citrea]
MTRSSLAIAAALTSAALTTTAAVGLAGGDGGAPGTASAAEPTVQPSPTADPAVRTATERATAVLDDADYVAREGDLTRAERQRVRAAARDLRAVVEKANDTAGERRPAAASRSTGRTPLAERASGGSPAATTDKTTDKTVDQAVDQAVDKAAGKRADKQAGRKADDKTTGSKAAKRDVEAAADPTAPTNLPGVANGTTSLTPQDAARLPLLQTPLAEAIDEPADAPEAARADAPTSPATRIEKKTASLERLIATTDAVVSVKAGPTPEEIAAAKKAAEKRKAAKAARAAERKAAAMAEAAKGYGNGEIPSDVLCSVSFAHGERLRCDAAAALEKLNRGFRDAFGRNFDLTDGYRSYGEQIAVASARGGLAAVPGTSNHGFGQAVDLSGGIESFGTAEHAWMVAHADRYGWRHPGWAQAGGSKPEPWHWEYGTRD